MVTEIQSPVSERINSDPSKMIARCGIYAIFCDLNGKYYVGSSHNMRRRIRLHYQQLVRGDHGNQKLLRAFRCHGEKSFRFKALEFTAGTQTERLAVEQGWINLLESAKLGFNIKTRATPFHCHRMTEPQLENMRAAQRLRVKRSDQPLVFNLISPTGEICSGKNVAEFCRERGFSNSMLSGFYSIISGNKPSSYGWKSVGGRGRKKTGPASSYRFISPLGEIISGFGLRSFCRENKLGYTSMISLRDGKIKNHKNWRKVPCL